MRTFYLILILLFAATSLPAQQIDIFGYFEPQLMALKLKNDLYQMSTNKLRVDLKLNASENVSFGANFDYITYHGKTTWDILEYLPESVLGEVPSTSFLGLEINPYILPFQERKFLDNAYLKLSFKYADITIGKQQLSFGTGYAWNPTDVFNHKDITDPTYEQEGHNAFRLDIPFLANWAITALYAPTDTPNAPDLMARFKGDLLHFDFSLSAIQKQWKLTDARIFDPILMNFYQVSTKRQLIGGDLVGEILGLGVWSEFAYNHVRLSDEEESNYQQARFPVMTASSFSFPSMTIPEKFWEWIVGVDYTFDFQTYIMLEFYRNEAAKANSDEYRFNDWMQLMLAETKTITRDQLYLFIQHPATDLITIGCSGIVSLSDESYGIIPMVTYNVFQNVDLSLFGNFYLGKEGTAYAKNLGNGGIFRARVYF